MDNGIPDSEFAVKNRKVSEADTKRGSRLGLRRSSQAVSKPSPWSLPFLGWLQGLLYRALSLGLLPNPMLILLGILQRKNTDFPEKKVDRNHETLATLPNQKWVARKRNHRGQLRHVQTYDHPPSHQELAQHGAGSFSILTTKPNLKLWQSLEIADKNGNVKQKPRPSRPVGRVQEPLISQEGAIETRKPKRRFTLRREVRRPSEDPTTKVKSSTEPDRRDVESLAETIRSAIATVQPTIDSPVSEPAAEPSKSKSEKSSDAVESRPKERCWKCLRDTASLRRCEFCERVFCGGFLDECYENHECSGSKVCHKCGRRVPNTLVEIENVCHQYFCSMKCVSECRRSNLMNLACLDCISGPDRKSESKKAGAEMEEEDGCEDMSPEEDEPDDEDVEEMCDGVPKRIACPRCQKTDCQGRDCSGYCSRCRFKSCGIRCAYDGECKFCPEFTSCEIRCIEAPNRCDRKHCAGFRCEDRWVSGAECDQDCGGCGEEGCYFFWHQNVEDSNDEE